MSSFTIKCGPAHKSRQSFNRRPEFQGRKTTRVDDLKRDALSNNHFSALASDTDFKPRPSQTRVASPMGSWRRKLTVIDTTSVLHTSRQSSKSIKRVVSPGHKLSRSCAYCHDEEHLHHIRDCHVLAEKNRMKAQSSRNHKEDKKQAKLRAAEARLAEQVRISHTKKETQEVEEETSGIEVESDEEFPALTTAIASGHVTVNRGTNWGAFRRVTFKDDSENLMKPPCETKVFNTLDAPTTISDEEEEEILLKPSVNAWKPRRVQKNGMTSQERQSILDDINEKEVELKSYGNDSWADACEIEELEEEIMALRKKLD